MTSQPVCLTCLSGALIRDLSTRTFLFYQQRQNIVLSARLHNAWHALMVRFVYHAIEITFPTLITEVRAVLLVFQMNTP
jgi:hypothetical protein